LIEACDERIPFEVCEALAQLVHQLHRLDESIARLNRTIAKMAQKDETARRLMSIPGFGPITASADSAHRAAVRRARRGGSKDRKLGEGSININSPIRSSAEL